LVILNCWFGGVVVVGGCDGVTERAARSEREHGQTREKKSEGAEGVFAGDVAGGVARWRGERNRMRRRRKREGGEG